MRLQRLLPAALFLAGALLAGSWAAAWLSPSQEDQPGIDRVHHEVPDDPPGGPAAGVTSPGAFIQSGPYVSIQVNVDGSGLNIVGDAANEPSIAVNPLDPDNIVVGWRQFDTISSNFRQAGWAYTFDGGQSWTYPGSLEPGVFRSDPVLDVDADGNFYYHSLSIPGGQYLCDVWRSTDGGQTWEPPVPAFGGDKNWLVVDRSGGTGNGNVYGIWQRFFNCCDEDTLTRSVDGGATFESPIEIPDSPTFGILDVGSDGVVWAAGIQANDWVGQNFDQYVVAQSANAEDPAQTPTFSTVLVDMGGSMRLGRGPNPAGLLGQAYVRADPTDSDVVYALGSVNPPGGDPLDVHFIRSVDGGQTWSAPLRINDDPDGADNWQWFGTMSVAPNGRIDVIWNDTRSSGVDRVSELYYAYSYDGGETWRGNEAVSPSFDSHLGWPRQDKLGDYYDMVSDVSGADLIWAATFNGEQDVYYLRLFPDCNGNGISDEEDVGTGASPDVDGDRIPDECEALTLAADPLDPPLGGALTIEADNGLPGSVGVLFLRAVNGVPASLPITTLAFQTDGTAGFTTTIPNNGSLSGVSITLATFALFLDGNIALSNEVTFTVQ